MAYIFLMRMIHFLQQLELCKIHMLPESMLPPDGKGSMSVLNGQRFATLSSFIRLEMSKATSGMPGPKVDWSQVTLASKWKSVWILSHHLFNINSYPFDG